MLLCKGKGSCGLQLPFSEFYKEPRTKRGYRNICKSCTRKRNQTYEYGPVHLDPVLRYKRSRKWLLNNPEWVRLSNRSTNARRRSRIKLSPEDRIISSEYRKAIENDPCFYCGQTAEMQDDHFYPLAKGGTDHWYNLRRACSKCNLDKSTQCGTAYLLKGKHAKEIPQK